MPWKRRKASFSRYSYLFCLLFPISFLLLILNARLPELTNSSSIRTSDRMQKLVKATEEMHLGEFGEMIIAMLPMDLPFTLFVPCREAFNHTLRLHLNDTLDELKRNDTFAILSRVMGFSTIPQHLPSNMVSSDEINVYSVSGYDLYVWKDSDNMLVVNSIKSKQVDIRRGELIIHVILGVLMDAEFEQSLG